ncbi:Glutaredoxin [uncultured Caudovirales phage]|uniref:Glutaredoxin n=1 Tax=uncultured Caudovirales phage TaxID=2100421 RepID=A0A6J5KRB0_9CAUD|nr:Glutaredoxin [uncultured Caudovirales phage]CAB5220682.1 Glutaredoxin [uncultured Caudovirales phage]
MTFLILSKEDCVWCDKAKRLINDFGGSWVSVDYKDSPVIAPLMKFAEMTTLPQIWADTPSGKMYVGGYEGLVGWLQESES